MKNKVVGILIWLPFRIFKWGHGRGKKRRNFIGKNLFRV